MIQPPTRSNRTYNLFPHTPLFRSVAQILSTIPNALPPGYAEELAELQANAPPMGWAFVRRRMAAELGSDWQSKFADFSHEAAAAASLGQVHRATDHAGRSEEHTSELQSLMRNSYAVFCLKKK